MSNKRNHRRADSDRNRNRTETGPRWENPNPGKGCNATHVARARAKHKARDTRRRRREEAREAAELASAAQPLYWCTWVVPSNVRASQVAALWPRGMCGEPSRTGRAGSWVGIVSAASQEAAEALLRSCYGDDARLIKVTSVVEKLRPSWWPPRRYEVCGRWLARSANASASAAGGRRPTRYVIDDSEER